MNKLFLLYIVLSFSVGAQSIGDRIIAQVGDTKIYESEFLMRFELTPQFSRNNKGKLNRVKHSFLYTLIAEKLWAEEMAHTLMDTSYAISSAMKFIEGMFVRDALYKIEVTDKITISGEMINEGLTRVHQNRFLNFLFSKDEQEIKKLYELLRKGIPFDSLLSARHERDEQLKPVEIEYGQMEENVEDSIFALSLNQYTSPLLTPDGWYIFRYSGSGSNSSIRNLDSENLIQYVRKIISKRLAK